MKKAMFILLSFIYSGYVISQPNVPFLKKNGKFVMVDSSGMRPVGGVEFEEFQKLPGEVNLLKVKVNGKWGFVNMKGSLVVPAKYDETSEFVEGRAGIISNGKKGFVDVEGREVVPPRYEEVLLYSEGMAAVTENDKCGFVDLSGKLVIPIVYNMVLPFSGGVAAFSAEKGIGLIDKTGKVVTKEFYDGLYPFKDGIYSVTIAGKIGFIDKNGGELVPIIYDSIFSPFREGFAGVLRRGVGAGFVGLNGREIAPFRYQNLDSFVNGLASVMRESKWGYIDTTGKEVIAPTYEASGYFSADGLASVRLNRKWGYIDRSGQVVIPFMYDQVAEFENGRAMVSLSNHYGMIDKTGKYIIPARFDLIESFGEGLAAVYEGVSGVDREMSGIARVCFIDTTGKLIIPFQYRSSSGFHDGLAAVSIMDKKRSEEKWGIIDKKGREIVAPKYDEIFFSFTPLYEEFGMADLNAMYMYGKKWPGFILVELNGEQFLLDYAGREYREK